MEACCVLGDALKISKGGKVVFEDLDFEPEPAQEAALKDFAEALGKVLFPEGSGDANEWRTSLTARICLVHDDIMSLLLDTATEVNAHIRLNDETKTVDRGALWYQESLPAESVLTGLALASDVPASRSGRKADELMQHVSKLTKSLVQLGGKATVGQGTCFVRIAGGAS